LLGGTNDHLVRNTLVVKKGTHVGKTVAAGYLRRTLTATAYWIRIHGGSYDASDPSICA
jgi:hypothetical protein